MANDSKYPEGGNGFDNEFEGKTQDIEAGRKLRIYGTSEAVKEATDRVRNGEGKPGDLDKAFGHL